VKNRKHTESSNTRGRWRIPLAILVLLAWALCAWWLGKRADHEMRDGLLAQARLAAGAVKTDHVKALTGTAADLESPDYLQLKEQFAAMRHAEPKCRFVYLMGQKAAPPSVPAQGSAQAGGDIFFFVDSEPADSKDCSPPGQVYEDPSDGCRRVFGDRTAEVEGPVRRPWMPRFDLKPCKHNVFCCISIDQPESQPTVPGSHLLYERPFQRIPRPHNSKHPVHALRNLNKVVHLVSVIPAINSNRIDGQNSSVLADILPLK